MFERRVFRVVPTAARWLVKLDGVERPVAACHSKPDAVKRAREIARERSGESCVIVYLRDGTVQSEQTYDWVMPAW